MISTPDVSFLWDEGDHEVDPDDVIAGYQDLINTGNAWKLEGAVGRQAAHFIDIGVCALGETDYLDYYGNHVPSRYQVVDGSKGSTKFVHDQGNEIFE